MKTKTTWAALAAGLTLGLALGQATKPVEAARQPKGVLASLVGQSVRIETPIDDYSDGAFIAGFDEQWVVVGFPGTNHRRYVPIGQIRVIKHPWP